MTARGGRAPDTPAPAPRAPVAAGRYYPAQAAALAQAVDRLLDAVDVPPDDELAEAYLVPHAGYADSGAAAACVHARLRRHAGRIDRVVLLGPTHRLAMHGCVVPAATGWSTPLGRVVVDVVTAAALARDGHVGVDDQPHQGEHALEVHLPFLQRALPAHVPVLPVAVGSSSVDDLVITLAAAVRPGTVVLCSSDLSAHADAGAVRTTDQRTLGAALALAGERIGVRDACGVHALRGLLAWARHQRLRPELLTTCTSTGAGGEAVGHAAMAFRSAPFSVPAVGGDHVRD